MGMANQLSKFNPCFSVWFGSSASPAALWHALEASRICVPFIEHHWTCVTPKSKPLELRGLVRSSPTSWVGQSNPLGNWSQPPGHTPQQDQPRLLASTNPSVQAMPLQVWLHYISALPQESCYTADTLSCAPVASTCSTDSQEEAQTEFLVSAFVSTLPASQDCMTLYWPG